MADEVNQFPLPPLEGSPYQEESFNYGENPKVMTQGDLNRLRETYSFPTRIQARIPNVGETILSTHPSEVAFYDAAFPAGLRFPIHPTIRRILNFYNIYPAQLSSNAW